MLVYILSDVDGDGPAPTATLDRAKLLAMVDHNWSEDWGFDNAFRLEVKNGLAKLLEQPDADLAEGNESDRYSGYIFNAHGLFGGVQFHVVRLV